MTNLPIYLLRQVYYFLLERPEINKKTNIEKIQDFFCELGLAVSIDKIQGLKIHLPGYDKFKTIDPFDMPNFFNELDFIQWVSDLLHRKV